MAFWGSCLAIDDFSKAGNVGGVTLIIIFYFYFWFIYHHMLYFAFTLLQLNGILTHSKLDCVGEEMPFHCTKQYYRTLDTKK